MTARTLHTLALVAVASIALAGCSSSDGDTKPTDTAAVTDEVAEGSTDAIDAAVARASERLDAAAGDRCGIVAVIYDGELAGSLPAATTEFTAAQAEAVGRLSARALTELAGTAGPGEEADAQALTEAADALIAQGSVTDWDPAAMTAFSSEPVQAVLDGYTVECGISPEVPVMDPGALEAALNNALAIAGAYGRPLGQEDLQAAFDETTGGFRVCAEGVQDCGDGGQVWWTTRGDTTGMVVSEPRVLARIQDGSVTGTREDPDGVGTLEDALALPAGRP